MKGRQRPKQCNQYKKLEALNKKGSYEKEGKVYKGGREPKSRVTRRLRKLFKVGKTSFTFKKYEKTPTLQ